jgi:hypothetical protein
VAPAQPVFFLLELLGAHAVEMLRRHRYGVLLDRGRRDGIVPRRAAGGRLRTLAGCKRRDQTGREEGPVEHCTITLRKRKRRA